MAMEIMDFFYLQWLLMSEVIEVNKPCRGDWLLINYDDPNQQEVFPW